MSRYSISIGDKSFDSKSKALAFYKDILNSYKVGEELREDDYKKIVDLVYTGYDKDEIKAYEIDTGDYIKSVIVDYHPDFRSTKCFFLMGGIEAKQLFSYLLAINGTLSDSQLFSRACRHLVSERLREFKKQQFKNRPVRCALTNEIVEWEECQIDHKAPLTFSVIVKSFIVAHKIDISSIEYVYENSKEQFANRDIAEKFDDFHKEMAVLRVLATKQNRKLSGGARIKPTKKDGTLT
jgi:hypothetical protein